LARRDAAARIAATKGGEMAEQVTDLREEAIQRLKKQRDFVPHAIAYVLVNVLVWTIWAFTDAGGFPWPVFVTAGWGIGIAAHAWDAFWRRPITEDDVERELARMAR
jgi:hypothetical protein